jgi:diguanylate cyclase (GGDEF)-like protein
MSALEDELTGLNNRGHFLSLLRRHITYANDRKNLLALIVVDVDGFAHINGAHGYEFGDRLLQHLARQVAGAARKQDYTARIGSDRFALLLPRVMNAGHAELAVQKLQRLLDSPFDGGEHKIKIEVTIGVALCPMHATHADFLLRCAEKAVETARLTGSNSAFAPDVQGDKISEFWDIEIELGAALDRGELALFYQPQMRIADLRPVGVEALMHWTSRTRGPVPADVFIPIAERTGQIKKLTIWALNTALRQAGQWQHAWGELSVAVNLPADLAAQQDLPELVENSMKLWGKRGVQLVLEITERSLMNARAAFEILSRIRQLGAKVSIDDFGTGYSCLAYFKNIPADELKVDKSFVGALLTDPGAAQITALIIDLAHRFGLSVVAEGVEDKKTLQALRSAGCDLAQGYLISKALTAADMQKWLSKDHRVAAAAPVVR